MPELRAIKPVSTAFEKARKLLLEPFDAWIWLKLVIITFFVGKGGASGTSNWGNVAQYTMNRTPLYSFREGELSALLSNTLLVSLIVLALIAILALVLLMSYLRGVFSFVLIDALTTGDVKIVKPFKENMGRGFKVFLFNVATTLVALAVIIAMIVVIVLFILAAVGDNASSSVSPLMIFAAIIFALLGILLLIPFGIIMSIITGFFYDFAVPLMYFKGMGLVESIKHVVGLVKREPLEFFVYVIVRWALEFAVGIVFGIISLIILAVFVLIGLMALGAAIMAAAINVVLLALIVLVIIFLFIVMLVVMTFVTMPVNVYFRYYSLDFLRSFDPSYVVYKGRFA